MVLWGGLVAGRDEAVPRIPWRWSMIRLLNYGCIGPDVRAVQQALNTRMPYRTPKLVPDGKFGPLTRSAVLAFQTEQDLVPDGIVGPRTRAQLFPAVGFT